MAMEFEYDDSGATFYYFLVSFFGLVLLPVTYFVWPRRKADDDKKRLVCQCEPCRRKRVYLEIDQPKEKFQRYARMAVVLVMWCVFAAMVYKVLTLERDYTEYDPYEILELDAGASVAEIRRQYRRLSKVYHPDKEGGDQAMFMRIAKAYEALTDEESKENLEKYGNPDGPQAASFGIALPAWIVEKQNSIWVLGFYVSIFMIVLPVLVGVWWYRSIKYGTTNLLIQTSQIFFYFLAKSSSLTIKRILMILTAAGELNPQHSKTAKERPSDNVELNEIIRLKALPHIDLKTKEAPFYVPYAAKSRILLHSHLERLELPQNTLALDKSSMLAKCPQLMNEMLNVLSQLWSMARYPSHQQVRVYTIPTLDTFENVMKVHQMIVQATWDRHSPLLQLPHLQPEQLKHFKTRKRNITTIEQFAAMRSSERRLLVRSLLDEEYLDMMAVCAGFPHVDITTEIQVVDDEDHHRVTAGSLVTVVVTLKRQGLLDYYGVSTDSLLSGSSEQKTTTALLEDGVTLSEDVETVGSAVSAVSEPERAKQSSSKSWEKQKKKKKGKAAASKPKKKQQLAKSNRKNAVVSKQPEASTSRAEEEAESQSEPESEEELERASPSDEGEESFEEGGKKPDEEEEEWKSLQESLRKRKKKKNDHSDISYPVHAPFFPEEKQECWWVYIADKKRKEIVTPPQRVTGLQDEHTLDLLFGAPEKPGVLRLTIILTSDSYLDLSFQKELKVEVHEKQAVSGTEQWKELEEEEEAEEVIEESESGEEEESDEDSED